MLEILISISCNIFMAILCGIVSGIKESGSAK